MFVIIVPLTFRFTDKKIQDTRELRIIRDLSWGKMSSLENWISSTHFQLFAKLYFALK